MKEGLVIVGGDLSNIDDIANAKALGKSKKLLNPLLPAKNNTIPGLCFCYAQKGIFCERGQGYIAVGLREKFRKKAVNSR